MAVTAVTSFTLKDCLTMMSAINPLEAKGRHGSNQCVGDVLLAQQHASITAVTPTFDICTRQQSRQWEA